MIKNPYICRMILVTGATGILGSVIVLELLKRGFSVRATKRKNSDLQEVKNSFRFYTEQAEEYFNKIEWVEVDFEDIDSLSNAIVGITEVYHCAGMVSFDPKDRVQIYKTNIEGTKNLLYACENSSVKKFLFVSSISVLDGVDEHGMMDEDSNFNPKVEHSAYAKSKHFSEMEVWRSHYEGLNTIIINPAVIIGSGNWGKSSGALIDTLRSQKYTFSGGTAYVDVRDVAEIAIQLMEKNAFGQRFILSSENKSFEEMSNIVRTKFGLEKVKILPKKYLEIARYFKIFSFIFPKLGLLNRANIEAITTQTPISNQKIIEFLDYSFLKVEDSLEFHIENFKKINNQ